MASTRPLIGFLWLMLMLPVATIGCVREGRLPTSVTAPESPVSAAPSLTASSAPGPESRRGRGHRHFSRRALIAEAKGALGAVVTGEQVYLQKTGGAYKDVPDTSDFRVALGVDLGEALPWWVFSVSGASDTGFVAMARGREDTDAEGITVTLTYRRGQPIEWTVWHRGHCRR